MAEIPVFEKRFARVRQNVERVIHGKSDVVSMALICLFAEGHLLIEDVPGVAKTSLARAIADSIGGDFQRVQFTPDLLPSDVTGGQVPDPSTQEFRFREGPVFCNVLLSDEINRAAPKTQSALLQVMAERAVTAGRQTHPVKRPFVCVATQNPIDHQGTYPLPEAQLDRFMMRLPMGYPDEPAERRMLEQALTGETGDPLPPVLGIAEVTEMMDAVRVVHVGDALRDYLVRITRATRELQEKLPDTLRLGISPRGTIALAKAARVRAAGHGRAYTTPDDVKAVAIPVLNHRLLLTAQAEARGTTPHELLEEVLADVAVPRAR